MPWVMASGRDSKSSSQGGLELSLLVLEGSNSQRTRAGRQQAGLGRRSSKWIVGDWSLLQSNDLRLGQLTFAFERGRLYSASSSLTSTRCRNRNRQGFRTLWQTRWRSLAR